jgi:hypothetical protein
MKKLDNIGGEFESFYNTSSKQLLKKFNYGTWFTCGRHALNEIFIYINRQQVKNIYIPIYTCRSIELILRKFEFKVFYYDIDHNFKNKLKKIKKNSAVLLMNYFGIKENFKLNNNDCKPIIINDLSHSFLQEKLSFKKDEFYFFSLRKFGVFNYGGWCNISNTKKRIYDTKIISTFSQKIRKIKQKYLNTNSQPSLIKEKKFLKIFKEFDQKLYDFKHPIKKNNLKIIQKIDIKKTFKIRRDNFNYLKSKLPKKYTLDFKLNVHDVPLGFFLFLKNRDKLRNNLKLNRIFCPIHWNISTQFQSKKIFSSLLYKRILTIPIDQRYNKIHLDKIINNINQFLNKHFKK